MSIGALDSGSGVHEIAGDMAEAMAMAAADRPSPLFLYAIDLPPDTRRVVVTWYPPDVTIVPAGNEAVHAAPDGATILLSTFSRPFTPDRS